MPRLEPRSIPRSIVRCALTAVLLGGIACMNDAPLASTDASAGLTFSANVVRGTAGNTIELAVTYRRISGEVVRVPALPERVSLQPGTTVEQAVTVDLAACLKDGNRAPANTPGCRLTVELRLLDDAGNTVDTQSKEAPGAPTAPGQTVELGSMTLGIQVGSIAVEPTSVQLNVTQTQQLTATVKDPNGAALADMTPTWTSSDPSVAQLSATSGASVTVTALKLGMATVIASRGGKSSPPIPVAVVTPDPLAVSPASASVQVGATLQLTVSNPPGPVTWESGEPTIASVDDNGLVRGLQAREDSPVTITATTGSGATQRSGNAKVTVTIAPPLVISQRPGPGCVIVGQTVTLTVASPPGAVTWSSDNGDVASVDPATGVVRGLNAGQTTVRATSANRSGSAPICVIGPLGNIPETVALSVGQSAQLSPSGTENGNVAYATDNAVVAPVSGSGVVTGVGIGQARITTTLTGASGSTKATTVVTVSAASITIAPNPVSVAVGATQSLTATARDVAGNAIGGVTYAWTVDDRSIVQLSATSGNPIDALGLKLGPTTVRVMGGGASGAATVTVTRGAPSSITVTLSTSNLTIGDPPATVTAVVKDVAGNVLTDQTVSWKTSNEKVATVTSSGPLTGTVTAVGAGNANIIASIGGVSGSATVQVAEAPVSTLTISPTSATISAGGMGQVLTAVPKDAQGNALVGRVVNWAVTAGDASLVQLSASSTTSTANGATVTVTGKKAGGPVTVTATSGEKSAASQITVTPGAAASITLTPATESLTVGQTAAITAVAKDANGTTITTLPNGVALKWQSSNPAVASVAATSGQPFRADVSALAQGTTNITARLDVPGGGTVTSNAVAVTVSPLPPANIERVSGDGSICAANQGGCFFTVRVTNALNQPVSGVGVVWTCPSGETEAPPVMTDAQGLATSGNCLFGIPGTYQMVATVDGTALSTTFTFIQSGLLISKRPVLKGVPQAGQSTFPWDVTAVGGVARGLSVEVKPQPNQPSITVVSATFSPTDSTPTVLNVVLCTCGLPTGTSGVLDVTILSTTPGFAGVIVQLNWIIGSSSGSIAAATNGAAASQGPVGGNPDANSPLVSPAINRRGIRP